ncbi:ligand-binding sensor domain-containing protein [Pedobacter sp. NJ-S-72]
MMKTLQSLSDDRVWDILEDRRGNLWVATLSGGLENLNRTTGTFLHRKANQPNSVASNYISCLLEDSDGNIWIGTSEGVNKMNAEGRFIYYKNEPGIENSLINNIVYDLMQDSHGFIWIATRDGISRFNPKTGQFKNFDRKDGLTESATLKILEDTAGNLWVSTANGLFNILVTKIAKAKQISPILLENMMPRTDCREAHLMPMQDIKPAQENCCSAVPMVLIFFNQRV